VASYPYSLALASLMKLSEIGSGMVEITSRKGIFSEKQGAPNNHLLLQYVELNTAKY
jgi:hypothetical protein